MGELRGDVGISRKNPGKTRECWGPAPLGPPWFGIPGFIPKFPGVELQTAPLPLHPAGTPGLHPHHLLPPREEFLEFWGFLGISDGAFPRGNLLNGNFQ